MINPTTAVENVPEKWYSCNGRQLKQLIRAGLYWLKKHHQHVNELNVFPVPDGDTGTNMLLTMESAWKRIESSDEQHVGRLAQEISHGALMGARGNSGVILSQIWRGMAKSLKDSETIGASDFGKALQQAAETAYGGVMKPVEGTILTVVREGAEESLDAAEKSDNIVFVMRRTLTRFNQSLRRTPDLLPILKQAGVVDSGGQGLIYIFDGMYKFMLGELTEMDMQREAAAVGQSNHANKPAQALAMPESGTLENHYDVQFILMGKNLDVHKVRDTIDSMGDSTVVVGDESVIKVHVHVDNPGEPLSYGISLGEITDVVVENMQMQMDEIVTAAPQPAARQPRAVEPGQIAVVTVAPGEGFSNILYDMGAAAIVKGGQTNNPSTEEIFEAIQDVPTDKIILLPNNKNIILAAEAARDLSTKNVVVVPTRTLPQGVSAMLSLNPDGDLEQVAAAMKASAAEVATVEITRATRTVQLNGVDIEEGNIIGIVDGDLNCTGESTAEVLTKALAQIEDIDEREIVTLFYGAEVSAAEAEETAAQIESLYGELEVEVQTGGQAHYFYILGVE